MAITILPRTGDPGGAIAAQVQLQTVIDDVGNVVMVVYGEGPDIERAIEVAVGRATIDPPQNRRVVWCPDSSVLSTRQKKDYFRANKVAVAIGLADKIAEALDIDEAQSGMSVELAFAAAEAQGKADNDN
jgi:hypothetical protein